MKRPGPGEIRAAVERVYSTNGSLNGHLVDPYADVPPPTDPPREMADGATGVEVPDIAVDGAEFILDQPGGIPALWGTGAQVLWAEGEALMIAGPQGVGKTTMAGMLVRALLGIGDAEVLGLPVADGGSRVLYLAMDRPRQIARSLGRQFSENDRYVLAERLVVRPGPPPADLAAQPTLLLGMADKYDADIVFVDSLKDAAVGLSADEVGAGYNRARQYLMASGRQIAEVHHVVKRGQQAGNPPTSIDQVYGSTWLTSGCGSVVLLGGDPGDPIVSFRHLKQPADEIGPWRLLHDPIAGLLTVEHSIDLVALVRVGGPDGLTARGAAQAITEKSSPSRADVEKARRRLTALVDEGVLVRLEAGSSGGADGGCPAAWFLAENRSRSPE